MAYVYYKTVVFDEIKKKEASRMWSNLYRDCLVRGQSIMADLMNPNYERWNAEFDSLYPNDEEDKMDSNSKYMKFIVEKHNDLLKDVTPVDWRVRKYYSNEEGCIAIETIDGKKFSLLLEPVEE